jgi:hypothetical protein
VPTLSKPAKKERSRRQAPASAPSAQGPEAKEPARPPLPVSEPDAPSTAATAKAVEPTPSTVEGIDDQSVVSESATVVHTPAPQPPDVTAEQPRSPWSAAADGGVAIGRQSKAAGVATAGFFTRFARRVAGSF